MAPQYSCQYSPGGVWSGIASTSDFIDITGSGPPPPFKTSVKMRWDNDHFYFAAKIEDPHVWTTMTNQNSRLYEQNNFEFFVKPSKDGSSYYEFEVNALGTTYQLCKVNCEFASLFFGCC